MEIGNVRILDTKFEKKQKLRMEQVLHPMKQELGRIEHIKTIVQSNISV
jgi:hypothetical protein